MMFRQKWTAISLAIGLAYAQDYPPGSFQLTPTIDLGLQPQAVEPRAQFEHAIPRGATLNLPPGFSVRIFAAEGLDGPRFMAFSPQGVLHVANMGRGQVIALPDRNQDGVADEPVVVLEGLREGHSLAFYKDALYVAEEHQVLRLYDRDNDGIYADDREVFIDNIPWEGGHDTRTIVFDEANEKLYLSVGSPCDLCRQEEGLQVNYDSDRAMPYSPERGTILQFNADGTGRRIFATGIRNAIGMDIHPVTQRLWSNHNHFDFAGPYLPPEWIDIIRPDGFYGLPFAYGYQIYIDFSIPQYQKILPLTRQDSLQVQRMQRPVALVPAHLAPMAMHFYDHDLFPARYLHAAFVALHGGLVEGNLAAVPGFKVIVLFSDPDGANARVADFLTGFAPSFRRDDLWGKPVGLATDDMGRLYLSSDYVDVIYRIDHSPLTGSWKRDLPRILVQGGQLELKAEVRLDRLVQNAGTPVLSADLSALGGPAALPLIAVGDNTFQLQFDLDVNAPVGRRLVVVQIEQGPHRLELVQAVIVVPAADEIVFAGGRVDAGRLTPSDDIALDQSLEPLEFDGKPTSAFTAAPQTTGWSLVFSVTPPVESAAYRALRLAFHPGDLEVATAANLTIQVLGHRTSGGMGNDVNREVLEDQLDVEGIDGEVPGEVVDESETPENGEFMDVPDIEGEEGEEFDVGEIPGEEVDEGEIPGAVPEEGEDFEGGETPVGEVDEGEIPGVVPEEGEDFEGGETPVGEVDEGETPGAVPEDEAETSVEAVEGRLLDLLSGGLDSPGVDISSRTWQVVEIPLDALGVSGTIQAIRLASNLQGSFYLGDIQLITAASSLATAVRETYTPAQTNRFALGQNYPNPFNRATVIRFVLPQRNQVELALFNLAGQKVSALVHGIRPAGTYAVHWDGRDSAGQALASGLYLYRLQAGNQVETRKLLLLR